MSNKQTRLIYDIEINCEQPTPLTFSQLSEWVIWQFKQTNLDGLSGAVHPPIPDAHWYPAVILPKEKRVQVFGHLDTLFNTPEEAAKQISKLPGV
jgi:hypothetical protein